MGAFLWHEWARFVAIFASVYTVWAAIWGILFRKFFWDFVNGTLTSRNVTLGERPCTDNDPCGILPAPQDALFVNIIVNLPIVQIFALVMGLAHLGFELVPELKKTSIYRSFALRVVTYTFQTFFAVLFYQGVNGAIYSFVAAFGFLVAQMKGEIWSDLKNQRGNGGASKA